MSIFVDAGHTGLSFGGFRVMSALATEGVRLGTQNDGSLEADALDLCVSCVSTGREGNLWGGVEVCRSLSPPTGQPWPSFARRARVS